MQANEIHIYVNMPEYSPNYTSITEALSSVAYEAEEKIFPAPLSDLPPVILHIGEGIYREKLVITRPHVTLLGVNKENTILVYGQGAYEIMPEGDKRGTFRTASVRIDTHDFTAKHITFQNDAGFGHTVGQALALYVDGDRNYFEDCKFLGSQDTLFTAPLPLKEASPGGFKGPGEFKPRIMGRHFYRNCFIQGDVDFIFGSAIAYFESCTIFSKLPGDRIPPESPLAEVIYGYVTAASTPREQEYGYVFKDCRLLSDCPPHSVYLGRPWREWAKTVFLHCELGEHIHPLGWNDWKKTHGHFYYGEYCSYGPGANPQARADFSHQLTDEEASKYTIENILLGWIPKITD
ncbi:MAG: pectin methylesterase [Lachnospiraceae bacterium]|nr:pectin methylesterase [Lachnospiraceae bacterium]